VEALTDRIEREARELLDAIEQVGGAAKAVERGVFQEAIATSAYKEQRAIESGDAVVVGVNRYTDESEIPSITAPDYSALAAVQRQRVSEARRRRDAAQVTPALEAVRTGARQPDEPLLPAILEAVRARATVGEISDVLREVWGVYRPV
jgi:methylmalonyl-CoA mutase N-terminal domain/subunit